MSASGKSRGHLLRLLGAGFGIAVGLGEMIGAGILRSPSVIASGIGDMGAILALWSLGALHAALAANVIVEMGTALPQAGGPYVFAHRAFGDTGGLIVGWTVWSAHIAGIAATTVAFADFLPLVWPQAAGHEAGAAVGVQVLLYGANVLGLREGRALQGATSILKALFLLSFALAAAWLMPARTPALAAPAHAAIGFAALVGAYQLIRGAYNGWDAPVYFSEESVAPGKSLPRALFTGLALTALLYVLVNAMLLHALGLGGTASSPLPFAVVLSRVAGAGASVVFAVGAMIIVTSCANANVMIAPRILFALSRDRLLPAMFETVNKGGSPHFAFLLTAAVSMVLASTGGFRLVFGLIGTISTLAAVMTEISFFVLRRREPDLARPFRAVLYPWLPALVLAFDAVLLVLFAASDLKGALFAAALCLLCVPLAIIARRARS